MGPNSSLSNMTSEEPIDVRLLDRLAGLMNGKRKPNAMLVSTLVERLAFLRPIRPVSNLRYGTRMR